MTSVLIRLPGWGGFFMGISASSVVVDQVNIAGCIGIFDLRGLGSNFFELL
jgi:hypothetical protein